jgi:transposase-like protein
MPASGWRSTSCACWSCADGRKELIALADGYRESTESWADLLRDCGRRGMRAAVLAAGDGSLGFWGALREVSPKPANSAAGSTKQRMCWPRCRSLRTRGRRRPWRRSGAEDKPHAREAVKAFESAYGAKFPKATAKITDDTDELLAFSG